MCVCGAQHQASRPADGHPSGAGLGSGDGPPANSQVRQAQRASAWAANMACRGAAGTCWSTCGREHAGVCAGWPRGSQRMRARACSLHLCRLQQRSRLLRPRAHGSLLLILRDAATHCWSLDAGGDSCQIKCREPCLYLVGSVLHWLTSMHRDASALCRGPGAMPEAQ